MSDFQPMPTHAEIVALVARVAQMEERLQDVGAIGRQAMVRRDVLTDAINGLLSALDNVDPAWRTNTLVRGVRDEWDDVNDAWVNLVAAVTPNG